MSFDKEYPNRKDHRKQYPSGSKRVDRTCRCHGSCEYCASGRQHKQHREEQDADTQIKEEEQWDDTIKHT